MKTITEYRYKIVKEDFFSGERAKRGRIITRWKPLEVGGLYMHLYGKSGAAYRVVECVSQEEVEL